MPQFIVKREYNLSFKDFAAVRSYEPYASLSDLAKELRKISSDDPTHSWPMKDTMQIAQQLQEAGAIVVENLNESIRLREAKCTSKDELVTRLLKLREDASLTLSHEQALVLVDSYIAKGRLTDPDA